MAVEFGQSNPIYCCFFQGNLHDRYGHIVALSAKFLCLKMEFHKKVKTFLYFLDGLYKDM